MERLKIAYHQELSAFGEEAAHQLGGGDVDLLPAADYADITAAVSNHTADRGVIPIEHTILGSVQASHDALDAEPAIFAVAETVVQSQLCLLGPAGSRLQQSLSSLNDRELGIMTRKGLFEKQGWQPPRSMWGANVSAAFTSPLDRYRKAKEVEGTMQLLNVMAPMAQVDPTVVDNLDSDEMVRGLAHRLGMPVGFVRNLAQVQQLRAQRQQTQQMAQSAAIAKDMAAAGKQGVDALAGMNEMGAA